MSGHEWPVVPLLTLSCPDAFPCRLHGFQTYTGGCRIVTELLTTLGIWLPKDVTYVCTDPSWRARGAASALFRELEDVASAAGKAIILEAVMPAVPFYKRLGLDITMQLQLMLPLRGSKARTELYMEEVMVWMPPSLRQSEQPPRVIDSRSGLAKPFTPGAA